MRRIALVELAVLVLLGIATLHEHGAGGVESSLIGLACLLLPAHLARLLAARGELEVPHAWLFLAELAALTGVVSRPVEPYGIVIALLASQVVALEARPRPRAPGASNLDRVAGAAVMGELALLVAGTALDRNQALARFLLFLPVVLEALSPARERSAIGALARTSRVAAVIGLGWLGGDWTLPGSLLVAVLATLELLLQSQKLFADGRPAPPPEPPRRFDELDSVRGLAALTVVFDHHLIVLPALDTGREPAPGSPGLTLLKWAPLHALWAGHAAVILFFVHSGFVLSLPFLKPRWPVYSGFLLKRICRIYCPYVVAVAAAVGAFVLVPREVVPWLSEWFNHVGRGPLTTGNLVSHALLVPSFANGSFDPVLWSLVHEMRVSILFPLLMLLVVGTRSRTSLVVALGAFIAGTALHHALEARGLEVDYPRTLTYLYVFVAGALLARHRLEVVSWARARSRLARVALFVLAIFLYCWEWLPFEEPWLHPDGGDDLAITGGSALLLVLALASGTLSRLLRTRPLLLLGRISYSLYLFHAIVELALLNALHDQLPLGAIFALSGALGLGVSVLAWRFVEEPSMQLGRRLAAAREVKAVA